MMTGSTDDGARGFGVSGRENNSAREFAASGRTTAGTGTGVPRATAKQRAARIRELRRQKAPADIRDLEGIRHHKRAFFTGSVYRKRQTESYQ